VFDYEDNENEGNKLYCMNIVYLTNHYTVWCV